MASYIIAEARNEGYYVTGGSTSDVLYAGSLKGAVIFVEGKLKPDDFGGMVKVSARVSGVSSGGIGGCSDAKYQHKG